MGVVRSGVLPPAIPRSLAAVIGVQYSAIQESLLGIAVMWLAKRAGFEEISTVDERVAMEQHFLITTPLSVDWQFFSPGVFPSQRPKAQLASFHDKLLVMKRGRCVATAVGFFTIEKLDELLSRAVRRVIALYSPFRRKPQNGDENQLMVPAANGLSTMHISFHDLFSRSLLSTSAFNNVLVAFVPRQSKNSTFDFHLKHFVRVPCSDLEYILPEDSHQIHLRPTDKANFTLLTAGGVGVTTSLLWTEMALNTPAIVALSAFGAYWTRTFFRYTLTRDYYKTAAGSYMLSNLASTHSHCLETLVFQARQRHAAAVRTIVELLWTRPEGTVVSTQALRDRAHRHANLDPPPSNLHDRVELHELVADTELDADTLNVAVTWLADMNLIQRMPGAFWIVSRAAFERSLTDLATRTATSPPSPLEAQTALRCPELPSMLLPHE